MQLELFCLDELTLKRTLEQHTGMTLELVLTNNSSSMMNFQPYHSSGTPQLRLHRMFLTANPDVLNALGRWLVRRRCKRSAALLDEFIHRNTHLIDTQRKVRKSIRPLGVVYDLQELYEEVNREEFDGTVTTPITWGRWPSKQSRRSIRLGSFTPEDNLIRIHPCLDQEMVPRYFIKFIVFHEMLHAYVGFETTPSGRRRVHTPRFNKLEQAHPDYAKVIAWHDAPRNLSRLMRSLPQAS